MLIRDFPRKYIFFLSAFLLFFSIFLLFFSFVRAITNAGDIPQFKPVEMKQVADVNPFEQSEKGYDAIGKTILQTDISFAALHVPNLRGKLKYVGCNNRPDRKENEVLMYFLLEGCKDLISFAKGEKRYLALDGDRFCFSLNNQKTDIWIEVDNIEERKVDVVVKVEEKKGSLLEDRFSLPERPFGRSIRDKWMIGPFQVNAAFLTRQKVKWYGKDLFLEERGGKEYEEFAKKQRISFGEGKDKYDLFAKEGDYFVWNGEKWVQTDETEGKPLLSIQRIEDRIMRLKVWDEEGKKTVNLTLLKSRESWLGERLLHQFKFIGVKSKGQAILEIEGKRMVLDKEDWVVQTDKGWKKLNTIEDLEAFVNGDIVGPLFIFEGVKKDEDGQFLQGILYSPMRAEKKDILIDLKKKKKKGLSSSHHEQIKRKILEAKKFKRDKVIRNP